MPSKMTNCLRNHSLTVVTVRLPLSCKYMCVRFFLHIQPMKQLQPSVEESFETCAGLFIWDISEIVGLTTQPA